jgi:hypothetical protein
MQIYDLSAVDGALLCGGLLLYRRSVKPGEAIVGLLAAATLITVHWLAPYSAYVAASIICPFSFIAYVLYSRSSGQRSRFAAARARTGFRMRS